MNVSDWVNYKQASLKSFLVYWLENNQKDPLNWPLNFGDNDLGSLEEQFTLYCRAVEDQKNNYRNA